MTHNQSDDRVPVARYAAIAGIFLAIVLFAIMRAASGGAPNPVGPVVELFGRNVPVIPVVLFVGMLLILLKFHEWNLEVGLGGFAALLTYFIHTGVGPGAHLGQHVLHELPGLANLAFMIGGFAVMAKAFENSKAGDAMPRWLPNDWHGGAMVIFGVTFLSAFLDNIAAALIGGVVAKRVFRGRVGVGFIAAITMAANLGGAPSPVGDTTTIMLVNGGVSVEEILAGIPGVIVAASFLALVAGKQQDRLQRIVKDEPAGLVVDRRLLAAVAVALIGVLVCTLTIHITSIGVWGGLLAGQFLLWGLTWRDRRKSSERKTDPGATQTGSHPSFPPLPNTALPWQEGWAHGTVRSALFLATLVACASLMPAVLPSASWKATLALGGFSAVFDNIPLTALALSATWGMWDLLAYAVGSGGSMLWFGSSAGVTLTKEPEFAAGRSASAWLLHGWHVPMSYLIGFFTIMVWNQFIELTGLTHFAWVPELAMFAGFGWYIWHMRQRPQTKLVTTAADEAPPVLGGAE